MTYAIKVNAEGVIENIIVSDVAPEGYILSFFNLPIGQVFTIARDDYLRGEVRALRQAAYTKEADPLNFKVQRGEATEAEWLDKIAEIKARFPYPSE